MVVLTVMIIFIVIIIIIILAIIILYVCSYEMGYKQSSRTNGLNRIEACMNMAYLCFESLGHVFNLWQFPYLVKSPAVILMLSWFLKNVHNSLSVNWKQNFLWKKKSNGHWQFRTLHWSPELSRTPHRLMFFVSTWIRFFLKQEEY